MPDLVEYRIKSDTKNGKTKIEVYVGIDALKIQLLSMFLDNDIRRKLREELTISTHVSNLEKQYKELLMNSILMLENVDVDKKGFEVKIKDFDDIKIRQAIGLFLYFMISSMEGRLLAKEQSSSRNDGPSAEAAGSVSVSSGFGE